MVIQSQLRLAQCLQGRLLLDEQFVVEESHQRQRRTVVRSADHDGAVGERDERGDVDHARRQEQHYAPVPERVIRQESAYLLTSMLQSVMDEGTAASSRAPATPRTWLATPSP